jgi:excisionase family DNA binding protein
VTLRTAAELALELGVTEAFVEQECRAGRWPHSEVIRRSTAFTPDDVAAIRRLGVRGPAKAPVAPAGEPPPRLMHSVAEAAELLSMSTRTLGGMLRGGALPSLRLGGRRYVAHEDLVAFVGRLRAEALS